MIDLSKLKNYLQKHNKNSMLNFYYYSAYPADGTRDYSLDAKHKFFTFLKRGLKFNVIKKSLKRINHQDELGQLIVEKGNMDVELTIDAVHNIDKYDECFLFSGDSDFLQLINYIKKRGKRVIVYSSKNSISQELRTGGNKYVDILKIEEDIWGNDMKYRL